MDLSNNTEVPRISRSVREHLDAVLELAQGYHRTAETVPIRAAARRVLAEDVHAPWDIPRFAQSAMDGYAVRFADLAAFPDGLPVSAEIFAGQVPAPLAPGTAARIMTGAAVPPGADTVVPFEQTHTRPGFPESSLPRCHPDDSCCHPDESQDPPEYIRTQPGKDTTDLPCPEETLSGPLVTADNPVSGANIRFAGEDVHSGDLVLTAGTRLEPRHLGAAAALGMDAVSVVRRPSVAVITTGDELLPAGEAPGAAQIIDSNGPYLVGALTHAGAVVTPFNCPDDPVCFQDIMDQASAYDLIVITGGASVGDRDVARDVLGRHGCEFVSVRMQPGKPQGAGRWEGRTPVLSLPGNPVSVAVSFSVFVRPLLDSMLGADPARPLWGTVSHGWRSIPKRTQFYPVRAESTPTGLLVEPATPKGAGSHLVTSLTRATHFAVVPESVIDVTEGDVLSLLRLD